MAIDTVNEKLATLRLNKRIFVAIPMPGDGIGLDDKKHSLHGYPAFAYASVVVPPVDPPVVDVEDLPKNFLQLCKEVCSEAGLAGGEAAISTTINQTGQVGRIVKYVRQAWVEIQGIHQNINLYWLWMRSSFEILTVAGQSKYAYNDAAVEDTITETNITRFRNWMIQDHCDRPKLYRANSSVGTQTWLSFIDWADFQSLYRIGEERRGQPMHISVNPQNKLVLGPTPDAVYVVTGDYMKGVQRLLQDTDTPDLPRDFEDIIIFKALIKYGLQKNAAEMITMGEDSYATYLGMLEGDQLAEIPIGCPLA